MDKRELAIWKGICESLREPIQNKRLWKPECINCDRYDRIEDTGCFLDRCKLNGESTWLEPWNK